MLYLIGKILVNLVIGAIAGYLAGRLMDSEGSMERNVLLGLVGGVIGSAALGLIGIRGSGFIGSIIVSVVGACILIWIVRKLR